MANVSVEMQSHADEIITAKDEIIARILETWGQIAEGEAINIITSEGRVDTGNLRNSISHEADIDAETTYVGTNNEYAIYNELGTGIYIEGGRQTPWMYKDDEGNVHITRGMKGIHFLRDAIQNNLDTYQAVADQELKNG